MDLTDTLLSTLVNVLATSALVVLALARWMQGQFDRLDDRLDRLTREFYAHNQEQAAKGSIG